MNEYLASALEINSYKINNNLAEINKRVLFLKEYSENETSKEEIERLRKIRERRESKILLIEELMLYDSNISYEALGIDMPSQDEINSIIDKLNNMTEEQRQKTIEAINTYVNSTLTNYFLTNKSINFLKNDFNSDSTKNLICYKW